MNYSVLSAFFKWEQLDAIAMDLLCIQQHCHVSLTGMVFQLLEIALSVYNFPKRLTYVC